MPIKFCCYRLKVISLHFQCDNNLAKPIFHYEMKHLFASHFVIRFSKKYPNKFIYFIFFNKQALNKFKES